MKRASLQDQSGGGGFDEAADGVAGDAPGAGGRRGDAAAADCAADHGSDTGRPATGGFRGCLPSRLLAKVLEVSRGTVVEAYEVLLEKGLIVTTAGSATRVAPGAANVPNFSNLRRTVAAAHYPAGCCGVSG